MNEHIEIRDQRYADQGSTDTDVDRATWCRFRTCGRVSVGEPLEDCRRLARYSLSAVLRSPRASATLPMQLWAMERSRCQLVLFGFWSASPLEIARLGPVLAVGGAEVPAGFGDAADAVVGDGEVTLPVGVVRVLVGEPLEDCETGPVLAVGCGEVCREDIGDSAQDYCRTATRRRVTRRALRSGRSRPPVVANLWRKADEGRQRQRRPTHTTGETRIRFDLSDLRTCAQNRQPAALESEIGSHR